MLANMYVSTSAVNGWQFNPAKWDWRNVKTWSSLVHSGIAGYKIGTGIENWVKRNANRKLFDQQSDKFVEDYNSKLNNQNNYSFNTYYTASVNGIGSGSDFIYIGQNEPYLTKDVSLNLNNSLGKYELLLQVYGPMYSEYNWVQTAAWEDRPFTIDPDDWDFHRGFYYNSIDIKINGSRYWRPGADFFFFDTPNASYFDAELTLCGKRGETWYSIASFSWGYSINNGKVFDYFKLIDELNQVHLKNVLRTLTNFNF